MWFWKVGPGGMGSIECLLSTKPTGGELVDKDAEPTKSFQYVHLTIPLTALLSLGQFDKYKLACVYNSIFIPLINNDVEFS